MALGSLFFYGKEGRPNEQSTSVRQNASGTMVLEGTLLIPNASGKHPAIVLVHGSDFSEREKYRQEAETGHG